MRRAWRGELAGELGLNARFYSEEIGKASMFKMLRSVFSKGMEALLLEFLVAAERGGIRADLWNEVTTLFANQPFEKVALNWVRSHSGAHERRCHEVEQVAEVLRGLGVEPVMTPQPTRYSNARAASASRHRRPRRSHPFPRRAHMKKNLMKEKLRAGQPAFGVSVMIPSPQIVEMIAAAGFDWVLLDCEHGTLTLESVELMAMAAEASGITAIARPMTRSAEHILQVLDRGVMGCRCRT
jgi:hypothetical protein